MTLKQSQGHQTYNKNVDPKHSYNHAKFERSSFNSVWEKGNTNGFIQMRKYASYFLWICEKVKNSDMFVIPLM